MELGTIYDLLMKNLISSDDEFIISQRLKDIDKVNGYDPIHFETLKIIT